VKLFFVALVVPLIAMGAAPARKPVIALMPPNASSPDLLKLGLLIEARASEILEAAGKTHEFHLRQVLAMARTENLRPETLSQPVTAELARQAMGADKVVTTVLRSSPTGLVLEGFVVQAGKKTAFKAVLPGDWPAALVAGSEAIAKTLIGAKLRKAPVQPQSTSEAALVALADCWAASLRQPLGVEEPVVISAPELEQAIDACRRAVELDPTLHFGLATMALLQAIAGDDRGAVTSLKGLDAADDLVESFTLARFWLLTRYQSNEAGVAYLRDAVAKHPAELILLSTLGEDYASLHDDAGAVDAWTALLAVAPSSSIALGHLSQAEARIGKLEEALAHAKRALSFAPMSREARLQLASRSLDLGRAGEAIETLEPLASDRDARAEHLLKLGSAHWLNGGVEQAAEFFQAAVKRAERPDEWRTRGRAHYFLALVETRRGNATAARSAMTASRETGLRIRNIDPALAALWDEDELRRPRGDAGTRPSLVPRESSLFPVDPFGDVEPSREKPPPPEGLILFRF